jgi:hypothetical protein
MVIQMIGSEIGTVDFGIKVKVNSFIIVAKQMRVLLMGKDSLNIKLKEIIIISK